MGNSVQTGRLAAYRACWQIPRFCSHAGAGDPELVIGMRFAPIFSKNHTKRLPKRVNLIMNIP